MIWIRADANKEIGTGHVMRCLSVAAALKKLGERVCFLVADENPVPLLEARGQEYIVLNSDYTALEDELGTLESLFRECGINSQDKKNVFLADSYFVTKTYLSRIREYMPVGYVDDKCISDLPVDLLINYNIFAEESQYGDFGKEPGGCRREAEVENAQEETAQEKTAQEESALLSTKSVLLLGTAYAPLREEFVGVDYHVREKASQVLITTGGSDKYNLAGQILRKAMSHPGSASLTYCVISGAYNVHYEDLKQLAGEHSNIRILSNVTNMSELMQESDIAVTAGGSTMYELSAVGVPIICFSFVDNQEKIVEGFYKKGLVSFGGNYLMQGEEMLSEVVEEISKLASSKELRRQYSEKLRHVVDGQGAVRLARALVKFYSPCGE